MDPSIIPRYEQNTFSLPTSNSMAPTILKVSRYQMIVIIQPRYAKTGMAHRIVGHQSPEMIILNPMLPLVWILHPIFLIRPLLTCPRLHREIIEWFLHR